MDSITPLLGCIDLTMADEDLTATTESLPYNPNDEEQIWPAEVASPTASQEGTKAAEEQSTTVCKKVHRSAYDRHIDNLARFMRSQIHNPAASYEQPEPSTPPDVLAASKNNTTDESEEILKEVETILKEHDGATRDKCENCEVMRCKLRKLCRTRGPTTLTSDVAATCNDSSQGGSAQAMLGTPREPTAEDEAKNDGVYKDDGDPDD